MKPFFPIFLFLLLSLGQACAPDSPETEEAETAADASFVSPTEEVFGPGTSWKGDLDTMQKRRLLRALIPYNRISYFIDGKERRGITYEALQLFERFLRSATGKEEPSINIVYIPAPRNKLVSLLEAGYGDLVAAGLTVVPELEQRVDFSDPLISGVREVPVGGPAAPVLEELKDLAGKTVYVLDSSAILRNLSSLSDSLQQAGLPPIEAVAADPNLEQEDIVDMVNAGIYPFTIIRAYEAAVWRELADSIRIYEELPVYERSEIAWAFRKNSPLLEELVNKFVAEHKQGTLMGNILLNRYLKRTGYLKKSLAESEREKFQATRAIFQKYGEQYGFNWLLLAAQGYQESGLDQSKVSSAGAVGIMQIKPSTAADPNIGIQNVYDLENNIHAGAKYMRFIIDRYFNDDNLDTLNKGLLALASYNAGQNRIVRLREQAAAEGLDPNVWFDNVELVVAREVGREPVQYVSNIYKYYLSYRLLAHELERRGGRLPGAAGEDERK